MTGSVVGTQTDPAHPRGTEPRLSPPTREVALVQMDSAAGPGRDTQAQADHRIPSLTAGIPALELWEADRESEGSGSAQEPQVRQPSGAAGHMSFSAGSPGVRQGAQRHEKSGQVQSAGEGW